MILLQQIQAILPALPAAQASSIQQHLTQILGNASSTNVGSTTANLTSPNVPTATPPIPPVSSPMPVMPAVSHTERLSHPPASTPPPLAMPAPPVAAAPAPVAPAPGSVNALELLKGLTSMGILSSSGNVADKPAAAAGSVNAYGQFRLDSKDLQMCVFIDIEMMHRIVDNAHFSFISFSSFIKKESVQVQLKCCIRHCRCNASSVASDIRKPTRARARWTPIWILTFDRTAA